MRKFDHRLVLSVLLGLLLALLAFISYWQVERSMAVCKYLWEFGIWYLFKNYTLFHHSIKDFWYQTSVFQRGCSENQWNTSFFLAPLFVFCDLLGGLSIKTICYFSATCALMALVLFYGWVRRYWGKDAAFFASILFGFSAIFQEIARSGHIIAFSLMIGMMWLLFLFSSVEKEKGLVWYLMFGFLTGLACSLYWILKSIIVIAVIKISVMKDRRKWFALVFFLMGTFIIISPGIWILCKKNMPFFPNNMEFVSNFKGFWANLTIFKNHICGGDLALERFVFKDRFHAHLYHPMLVIPYFVGIVSAILEARRQSSYRYLILLSGAMYLVPICFGYYDQARHCLFYIIPSYCLIGLGLSKIIRGVEKIDSLIIRGIMWILLIGFSFVIFRSEFSTFQNRILANQRDHGIFAFADSIRKLPLQGRIYYLERPELRFSKYGYADESGIFNLALMDKGSVQHDAKCLMFNKRLIDQREDFYIAKSPAITIEALQAWCSKNSFYCREIIKVPVLNGVTKNDEKQSFILYKASWDPKIAQSMPSHELRNDLNVPPKCLINS